MKKQVIHEKRIIYNKAIPKWGQNGDGDKWGKLINFNRQYQ